MRLRARQRLCLLLIAVASLLPGLTLPAPLQTSQETSTGADSKLAARPRVTILTTGGTIAGRADPRSKLAYNSGQVGAQELIAAVPGIEALAQLSSEPIAAIGSQHMNDRVWFDLARRIGELLSRDSVDGEERGRPRQLV